MDMLTFEDQDGKIYDVPVNRAHEFAQMVKKEGKIVRGRTQMDDVRDAANPWSMANLAAGAKGLVESPNESNLKYMGENLLKGIGTAAGAVLGGAVKGIAGVFGGVAEGGARLGELVGNGIDKLNGGEGDNHTVSESISKVRKGFDEFIDLFTPNWFDPNSEIRRKHRMARGYGIGFDQLDDAQQKRIISERGLLPKDFGEKDPQEQEKIWGELKGKLSIWENRGYARDDESDVAAKDAVGGVKWLAELGGELRYGLGVVNKLAQFSSKIGQLAKLGKRVEAGVKAGTLSEETAAGLAKAAQLSASEASAGTVGSIAQKAASAAHKGVSAAFGLGRYAEMSGDENGPGGWRQEVAALVGGAINAALFTKGLPFSFGSKAASPFAKESLGEFTRRWLTRATQSGLTMAADTGAKEGVEAIATTDLRDENGNPVRWNPKTAQEVTKEILTQFAVGFGTHTIDALEESAKNTAYGRRYIAAGGQGENGEKLATRRSVEENRKIYCPMLNRQAQLVSDMHASGMPFVKGVKGTENVSGMGEDGSVMFDDHSTWRPAREWTVKGSDGKDIVIKDRATITTGDGCIMDAETGEVVGVAANGTTWESRQKTVEQKYRAEGAKEPEGTADISGTTSGSPDWDANMPGDVMDYIGGVRRANDDFAAWKAAHDAWEKDPNRDEVEEPKLSLVLPDRGKLTPEGEAWLALSQMARTPDESANVARLAMQDVASGKKTLAQAYADAKKALGMEADAGRPETEKKTALTEVGKDAKSEVAVPTDTVAKNDTPVDGDVKGGAENAGVFLDLYEQGKLPVHEDCEIAGLYLGPGFRIRGEHAAPENGEPVKPIIVWIGKEGERELISGDKRVMAAERAGEKTIKAVYVREIDGWTRDSARNLGNLENIRDGNGSIVDMMRAFDAMGVTSRDQLRQLGIGKNLIWANWAVDYLREAGPELRARINNGENIPVDFIHGMTKRISMATCGDKRDQMQKIILEDVVGQLDTREGREVINVLLERVREIDLNDRRQVEDAIAESRRRAAGESGLVADQVPVETEDGSVKTLAEVKAEAESGEGARPTETADEPESTTPVADAVENAANNLGVELKPVAGNVMGCARFPEIRVQVTKDGIVVDGLTADMMTRPENISDVAAFLTRLSAIRQNAAARGVTDAEGNPPRIYIGDEDAIGVAAKIAEQVAMEGGLKAAQAKFQTRSKLFDILAKTALGNGTTFDPASFLKAIRSDPNGRTFTDPFGNVYGLVDSNGVMHFNPYVFNFNTPIHEYGHLALEAVKRINNPLWKKGMELVRKSEYYTQIAEGDEYAHLRGNEEAICDEALATMIGDRGERLVISRGVDAQLKQWIKSFWRAFKGAFGIADLTEEQIEKMSLGDFVNAINAELLRGREFGTRKGIPLTKQSIQRYDEANGSGSNGVLRWKNDRGYLFAIPVDMERTQPGGKVVFATDDANITDWIQNRLNGLELRLSKSGKIYIKGRDGLDGELAEIFGRYPTIGQNDGIYGELANSTGNQAYRDMSPGDLVEALRKDRANYDSWKQNLKSEDGRKGKSLEQSREDQHYRDEEEREAFERWEQSGMSVMDYIRSRVEEGDPEFDLDWETAREIEYDRATGRFQKGGKFSLKPTDYKQKKKPQTTNGLSLPAGKDPGRARGMNTVNAKKAVSAVRQSLEVSGIIANAPKEIKGVFNNLVDVIRSIEDGRKVLGMGKPVSEQNFIAALFKAGIDQHTLRTVNGVKVIGKKKAGSSSGYFVGDGRTTRVSTHAADSQYFIQNGTGNNMSFVIQKPQVFKPFTPSQKVDVLEIVFNRESLKNNPEDMARIVHDIARFVATGEYNDTIGAAKYNYSGSNDFIAKSMRGLINDAQMRNDVETEKRIRNEARSRKIVLGGKFSVGRLYTGSAADYEKPSLLKVGTGEGSQVYGWGLYASSERGVAEKYANLKDLRDSRIFTVNGKEIELNSSDLGVDDSTVTAWSYVRSMDGSKDKAIAAMKDQVEAFEGKPNFRYEEDELRKAVKYLETTSDVFKVEEPRAYIYEQTFFTNRAPGDESHLLKWYEPVSEGMKGRLISDMRKEFKSVQRPSGGEVLLPNGKADWREGIDLSIIDGTYGEVGGGAWYDSLKKLTGSPKAASEWLAAHDIDGIKYPVDSYGKTVKDGDKAGWNYVSFRDDNINVDHKWRDGQALFSLGSVGAIDPGMFAFDPSKRIIPAMGDTESGAAGLAGAAERKAALRPWTSPESPAAHVKPIAFDAADLIMFARATNNRIKIGVQKGERIKGHRNAIGLNTGGTNIDIVSRLFGTIDEGDISRMREECRGEGFFRNENVDWCAMHGLEEIEAERQRSENELSRRKQDLFEKRVRTGEGGQHYAAEVLAHEIGHTIHMLAEDANLGPVGNNARTLLKAMTAEFRKKENRPGKDGAQGLRQEMDSLIAWWHGTDEAPKHYEKAEERFAEVFGIFLTQPESVHAQAPRIYETCRDLLGRNLKLKNAYEQITAAKWSGKADDMLVAELEKTWSKEAERQLQELDRETRTPTESKWDRFNYALNDRFGPMFGISNRGIKAEENRLKSAVESGAMSPEEMKDRLAAMTDEVNALKTSLYDWQRQTGGSVRLFVADINDVIRRAEKDGVSWNLVRRYAHLMRVIEIGGRATAHGIDPARASKLLDRMAEKDGAEAFAKIEKTWKAFRAVCEKHVLDDPNVKELFDDMTNKMLWENKNYVTMKHRASVEEVAEWRQKIDEARKSGEWTGDILMDAYSRLHKGLGGNGESFVLHRLEGSFKATVDPIAATLERYVALKQAATKNHLVKQLGDTLRACGVKDVFEDVKERPIDTKKYGTLSYMLKGERHYLTVPKVIADGFKQTGIDFGKLGQTIRVLNAFKTVWNPLFVGITAYPQDLGAIVTNVKGLHKDPLQIIADAIPNKWLAAPVHLTNNYLSRMTNLSKIPVFGNILWNENTPGHLARQAQRIATICVKGNFGEMAERAAALRAQGRTGEATEIEQDVMIARECLKKNIFHSNLKFTTQYGASVDEIISSFNIKIIDNQLPKSFVEKITSFRKYKAFQWLEQFGEIQEAVPKIILELHKMRTDPTMDADARARLAIEQGGTPNLSARGTWAGWVEMSFGPFWNVRKQSVVRSYDAFKDHPTEWLLKNFGQTVAPAIIKEMIVTGGLTLLIKKLFDGDEEKISKSWWANPIMEFSQFMNHAYKCVPAYYQRNYKIIPLGTFNGRTLSMKVRYSPEEHLLHNAVHTLFNKFGADPTDPTVDWSNITGDMLKEILPTLDGRNEIVNFLYATIGPLLFGSNGRDGFRDRTFYDEDTFRARWDAPGPFLKAMGRNAWNYSPFGTYLGKMSDPRDLKKSSKSNDGNDWLDFMLSTPFVNKIPSSMLLLSSIDSYNWAIKQVDKKQASIAIVKAKDILAECIKRGNLGGFSEGLKDIDPKYHEMAVRHVWNGWKQYNQDPKLKMLKDVRSMKDPELQRMVWKAINDGERFQD